VHGPLQGLGGKCARESPELAALILGCDFGLETMHYILPWIEGQRIDRVGGREPNAGSYIGGNPRKGRKEKGEQILTGSQSLRAKGFVAGLCMIATCTNLKEKVERTCVFIVGINGARYSGERVLKKLGTHCSDTAGIAFEDCRAKLTQLESDGVPSTTRFLRGGGPVLKRWPSGSPGQLMKYGIQFGLSPLPNSRLPIHMPPQMTLGLHSLGLRVYRAKWILD